MLSSPHLVVSLDVSNREKALSLAEQLDPAHCRLKVGKELFTRAGPALVEALQEQGYRVFLDLKYHDIPHTVASACLAAARLGVWMVNVHVCGGRTMLNAARAALDSWFAKQGNRPLLIGVTVLTSMNNRDLAETGVRSGLAQQALRLAKLAQACRLDGVVCSGHEAAALRRTCGRDFCLVTPGIRLPGRSHHDQGRVMSPGEAVRAGSNYLVVGRPITRSRKPLQLMRVIAAEIEAAIT